MKMEDRSDTSTKPEDERLRAKQEKRGRGKDGSPDGLQREPGSAEGPISGF